MKSKELYLVLNEEMGARFKNSGTDNVEAGDILALAESEKDLLDKVGVLVDDGTCVLGDKMLVIKCSFVDMTDAVIRVAMCKEGK